MDNVSYHDDVEYIPMLSAGAPPGPRRGKWFARYRGIILYVAFLVIGLVIGSALSRKVGDIKSPTSESEAASAQECHQDPPPLTILDSFHNVNSISPAHYPIVLENPSENAIVTSLYSDGYTIGVSALGHSLSKVNSTARKILMYLPDRLSTYTLCHVQAAGWELHPVTYVPPPNNGSDVNWMYVDQYTKLRLWTLDQIGIKSAVYLDGDTLVKQNFDELLALPFEFGASPDVYLDGRGFSVAFNAGVMALKPNTEIFDDMMSKVETAEFEHGSAEQSYLNLYFGQQVIRLPHVYNGNLAIKVRSPSYWKAMQEQLRIVHFTLIKPFNGRPGCGDHQCTVEELYNPQKHKDHLEWAKQQYDGRFREEMDWWEGVYEEMMEKVGPKCNISEK